MPTSDAFRAARAVEVSADTAAVTALIAQATTDGLDLTALAAYIVHHIPNATSLAGLAGSVTLDQVAQHISHFEYAYAGTWRSSWRTGRDEFVRDLVDGWVSGEDSAVLLDHTDLTALTEALFDDTYFTLEAPTQGSNDAVHVFRRDWEEV